MTGIRADGDGGHVIGLRVAAEHRHHPVDQRCGAEPLLRDVLRRVQGPGHVGEGIEHAVAHQEEGLALLEHIGARRPRVVVHRAQGQARGAQLTRGAVRAQDDGQAVARVDVLHAPRGRVHPNREHRHEGGGLVEILLHARGRPADGDRQLVVARRAAHDRTNPGCDDGGGDALAHDVGHHHLELSVTHLPVVEVPTDVLRRDALSGHIQTGDGRRPGGQESALHLPGLEELLVDAQLALHPRTQVTQHPALGRAELPGLVVHQAQCTDVLPVGREGLTSVEADTGFRAHRWMLGEPRVCSQVPQRRAAPGLRP